MQLEPEGGSQPSRFVAPKRQDAILLGKRTERPM